jgi:hypothetical protein
MKTGFFFLTLTLCLLPSFALASTAYYVDCSASSNGDGTFARPWNNIATVNSKISSMSDGDDIYFKYGTTCEIDGSPEKLNLSDIDGTSSDQTIIGCYEGAADFNCTGQTYPIIDGNSLYPNANYEGIIYKSNAEAGVHGYITIQQLHLKNPYGPEYFGPPGGGEEPNQASVIYLSSGGGSGGDADGPMIVDDCEIECNDEHCQFGVGMWGSTLNVIKNSYFHNMKGKVRNVSVVSTGVGNGLTVQGNVFQDVAQEVIGIYNGAQATIEKNVFINSTYFNVYMAGLGGPVIVRYNLMYNTGANIGSGRGVVATREWWETCDQFGGDKGIDAYGNIIIGLGEGMNMSDEVGCNATDWHYFNNTLIDNDYNFRTWGSRFGSGNTFKNNISWTITSGTKHVDQCSPTGITFANNLWSSDPGSGNCDAASDPANAAPGLVKTSGWRSLTAGAVSGQECALISTSPARGAGVSIVGHNERISYSDFTAKPIKVTTTTDSTPDIGAWMIAGNQPPVALLAAPPNLRILPAIPVQ